MPVCHHKVNLAVMCQAPVRNAHAGLIPLSDDQASPQQTVCLNSGHKDCTPSLSCSCDAAHYAAPEQDACIGNKLAGYRNALKQIAAHTLAPPADIPHAHLFIAMAQ